MDGSSNSGFDTRQTFVGLDGGNLGVVRIGYVNNFLNDQYSVDQWQYNNDIYDAANPSGANGLAVFSNSGDRIKNAIRYDSASFFGFQGGVEYGFGENNTKNPAAAGDSAKASSILGAGLNYTWNNVSGHYAYQKELNPNQPNGADLADVTLTGTNGHSASKNLFEVDYSDGTLFVSGAYQTATGYTWTDDFAGDGVEASFGGNNNPVGSQLKTRQAALSAAYTIGAFTPQISLAKGWDAKTGDTTIDNSGYKQWVVGVNYALSKRTTAGLSYGQLKFDQNSDFAQYYGSGNQDVTLKTVGLSLATSF
jgi:predicted porin